MKQIFAAILTISLLSSCKAKAQRDKSYGTKYAVGQIPNKEDFLQLNEEEKSVDSMFSGYDKEIDGIAQKDEKTKNMALRLKRDFVNNRSRIFLQAFENGKETRVDSAFVKGVSSICECLLTKDTLVVTTGVGFFGGMGFQVKIAEDGFQSTYFLYEKNAQPFKLHINDNFTNKLSVDSKYQSLMLDKKTSFTEGERLTGYLEIMTNNYYENSFGDKLDTNYVKGKVLFTCTAKKAVVVPREFTRKNSDRNK